jgi:hypothetical protein
MDWRCGSSDRLSACFLNSNPFKPQFHQTNRKAIQAGHWWLTPVNLATQEAEIRKMEVRSQPQANSSKHPIPKKTHHKKKLVE